MQYALCLRSSVNRWECDENDHLNVRFYVRMMYDCLQERFRQLGVTRSVEVTSQHMRFVNEARLATPISGWVAEVANQPLTFLVELRHTGTDDVLAAFLVEVAGDYDVVLQNEPLPAHAGSRGVPAVTAPFANLSIDDAKARGFITSGLGVVAAGEVAGDGFMAPPAFMWRMSDSMPNLWQHLQTPEEMSARSDGFVGGAVVEYRMDFHRRMGAGDSYEVLSGVSEVTEKLQHFVHLFFNVSRGECVMSARAVGLVLDLATRRSMVIPPERRTRMLRLRVDLDGL